MCGRYTHLFTWKQLHTLLSLLSWPEQELAPRFNVAPMQTAPVVRLNDAGERTGSMLRWGLVPSWADDPAIGSKMINARAETAFDKPAFRKALQSRRCLVPISGFYEWQAIEGEKTKQPWWIGREDRAPLCLAGLWESWKDKSADGASSKGGRLETYTVLTTSPNRIMQPLHDRMPVILPRSGWDTWLDSKAERPALEALVRPYEPDDLIAYRVSRRVNSPKTDEPSLMEPDADPPWPSNLFQ